MTTQQTFRVAEILRRNNFSDKDIDELLANVEPITKSDMKEIFATKEDMALLRSDVKEDIRNIERSLDRHFKWLVGILIAFFTIAIAILKH